MEYLNRRHRRLMLRYNKMMEERRLFMKELQKERGDSRKDCHREIKKNIGPTWYQVLSVNQRTALDTLHRAIYQDIIEGLPIRTMKIMRILGIIPLPDKLAVQHCMYLGRSDCKEFLAQLFLTMYDHPISSKRYSYDLNMRIILSSIYYLGLDDLIKSLQEEFKPDEKEPPPPPQKKKGRPKANVSPYLQEMAAPLYLPATPKQKPVPPLPDLSFLNQDVKEEKITRIPKPPPPPPPPPPPKKRLPRGECDELADIISFTPPDVPKPIKPPPPSPSSKKPQSYRRLRCSKMSLQTSTKKKYGIGDVRRKRKKKNEKPKSPSTGLANVQFNIVGTYTYKGSSYFINGGVFILPPHGILINGGHVLYPNGEYGPLNLGFCDCRTPPPEPCECMEKWEIAAIRHVQNTKCYCDHRYDFGNEGSFSEDEVPYFTKPTRTGSMTFNYDAIYEMDPKMIQVHKEAKKIWETESILQEDDDSELTERRKKKKKKKEALKLLLQSQAVKKNCLGDSPDLEDYLRCGLRILGRVNVAARLPDLQYAPELKAWMRFRSLGPYTTQEKEEMSKKSALYRSNFKTLLDMGLGKVKLPSDPSYSAQTTWKYKLDINKKFKNVISDYRIKLYKTQANVNNLLWATTYDSDYPDEKFREIYFTYLPGRLEDVVFYHPYCRYETAARAAKLKQTSYSSRSNQNGPQ